VSFFRRVSPPRAASIVPVPDCTFGIVLVRLGIAENDSPYLY
jgi:hypothetical protein